MDKSNTFFFKLYKCIIANTSVIWQHAAHTTDQLTTPNCWTEAVQKSLSLSEKYWRIYWKKFRRKGQHAEKNKTETVTELGRRTREEIAKWNQMTAPRFKTGGRHQTSSASLRGNSSGNARPYSSQLAEPMSTDSDIKSGISVCKMISTLFVYLSIYSSAVGKWFFEPSIKFLACEEKSHYFSKSLQLASGITHTL